MKTLRLSLLFIFIAISLTNIIAQDITDSIDNSDKVYEYRVELKLNQIDSLIYIDTKAALKIANEALLLSKEISSAELTARCYLAIGSLYAAINYPSQSLFYLTHALDYFKLNGDDASRIRTLYEIGEVYRGSNELESANKYFDLVLDYGQSHNDTLLIIKSLSEKGAIYGNTEQYSKAIQTFKLCIDLCKKSSNIANEIKNRYYLADVLLFSKQLDASIKEFEYTEENYDIKTVFPKLQATFHSSMSYAYLQKGNLGKALEYYNKSAIETQDSKRLHHRRKHAYLGFSIDTALGNYQSAIDKLLLYTKLDDTINENESKEQLANFEYVYNLDEKNKTIETLSSQNKLKELQLQQNKRYLFITLLFLVLALYIFNLILRSRKRLRHKNTELNNVLSQLKATQQNLIQSEKMASLGTLIAGVAHEINNPLNFISGGVELMKVVQQDVDLKQCSSEDILNMLKEPMQIIEEGIDRSTSIVNSLSTFSYSANAKKTDYKIVDILDSTLRYIKTKLTHIDVVKNYHFNESIKVFPDKLHQVFLNLLDNAVFALNNSNVSSKVITVTCEKVLNEVVVKIANSGPPIPEDIMNSIFDPFFTTKGPGKGTGLGLSICYKLIQEHNGEISVENIDSKVIFFVRLPYTI